jgi:hypothetical protein
MPEGGSVLDGVHDGVKRGRYRKSSIMMSIILLRRKKVAEMTNRFKNGDRFRGLNLIGI